MPGYKSLLVGMRWVKAGRSRKCYHNPRHAISKGDSIPEVRVGVGWQGYCDACAAEMIRLASAALAQFLGRSAPTADRE